MGFLDRFKKKPQEKRAEENADSDTLKALLNESETITEEQALNIPAVAKSVEFISNIVAMTPFKLYKKENEKVIEVTDDRRTFLLNNDTGDTLNAVQNKKAITNDYLLHGVAFNYIHKTRNRPNSLHYVKNGVVSVNKGTDEIFKTYTIRVNGVEYNNFDFLKFTRRTKDGITGKGILQQSPELLKTAYMTLLLEKNLVLTGGNKKGFLKSKNRLTKESMDALKEAWKKLYSNDGTENVIVLNDGLEFEQSGSTSVELQMNEKKKTLDKEIYDVFGISDKYDETIKESVIPILIAIECELNRNFLLEKEKGIYFFKADTTHLLRGSLKERYEAYAIAVDKGFLGIDEVREKEDEEAFGFDYIKLNQGDVFFNPKNKDLFVANTSKVTNLEGGEAENEDNNKVG